MREPAELADFYDRAYSEEERDAAKHGCWRALGAVGKADHVVALCERAGVRPASTLDIGCGDGALLSELHRRDFGGRLAGLEISEAAAAIARRRTADIPEVASYDGIHVPAGDSEYDLGILCHVLEHVPDPGALLAEAHRACDAVIVEVPLEANLSARRAGKRAHAAEIGHISRLDRRAARELVRSAGLSVEWELEDALPLEAHRFFADTTRARVAATAKWALRTAVHRAAPPLARRLFTLHYACLCLPGG